MQAHTEVTSPITPSMHTMYTTHTCVTPYTLYSTACHPMHMLVMHNMAKQEVTPDHLLYVACGRCRSRILCVTWCNHCLLAALHHTHVTASIPIIQPQPMYPHVTCCMTGLFKRLSLLKAVAAHSPLCLPWTTVECFLYVPLLFPPPLPVTADFRDLLLHNLHGYIVQL